MPHVVVYSASFSCEYCISGRVCLELCRREMRERSSIKCAVLKVLVQPRAECRASMRRMSGSTLLCLNVFRKHKDYFSIRDIIGEHQVAIPRTLTVEAGKLKRGEMGSLESNVDR